MLSEWNEITIENTDALNSWFGDQVSLRDNQLLVGAPGYFNDQPHRGGDGWGRVYVYDPITGAQTGLLTPNDDQMPQWFGSITASDGVYTAVTGSIDGESLIYIYEGDSTTPSHILHNQQDAELGAYSIAMDNNLIAVMYREDLYESHTVLFDISTGSELARFPGGLATQADTTTQNIAMHDGLLALRTGYDDGTDAPRVFVYSTETFELVHELTPEQPEGGFGASIAINDEYIVVGNAFNSVPSPRDADASGVVEIFDRETGERVSSFMPGDIVGDPFVANSIAINDRYVAIGSLWNRLVYLVDLHDTERAWRVGYQEYATYWADEFGASLTMDEDLLVVGSRNFQEGVVVTYNIGCPGDRDGDRSLTTLDAIDFIQAFVSSDNSADLNEDGLFDFHDVSQYMRLYQAGCFE
ncbi:MAG: GC-type dockerin domain-anchored protein [Phycisphaerales bacterium JB052]